MFSIQVGTKPQDGFYFIFRVSTAANVCNVVTMMTHDS